MKKNNVFIEKYFFDERIYFSLGFPAFMNRWDPEKNAPGHVAKVELWGNGAVLSFLTLRAISY